MLPGCAGSLNLTPSDHETVLSQQLLDAPHPGQPGHYAVKRLYYGSGTDRHRAVFRDSVAVVTESVDASKLVSLGDSAKRRNSYWGFTPEEFPINGRVWYPDGAGPFPLALIVHGNHNMKDFSDPGYGYLGELLASRGIILVSVDMNFINGGIGNENDGRGWMLLKHLEAWRGFVETDTNPFYQMADLDRVAIMGHSRGGEAVGHAAAFNRLERYPDDASFDFNFDFGIRAVVAIAPVDGQYLPAGRHVPVENVNYMVFHGSHDGDVSSFAGLRQYRRVTFTDDNDYFKTAIYMYRANHGQWNTVWGSSDYGPRGGRTLDLRGLIPAEDQREFAKIYISAFLEATLHDDDRYLPIFRDHRVIGEWLPKTMYITRFESSDYRPLATFEEDIDVTTGSVDGVVLHGDSLGQWSENLLGLRTRGRPTISNSQQSNAVWLGWNNKVAGEDDSTGTPASYSVTIPTALPREWDLNHETTLDFLLSALDQKPGPRKAKSDSTQADSTATTVTVDAEEDVKDEEVSEDEQEEAVDLTIEVRDVNGNAGRAPLSRYGPIRKPLDIKVLRRKDRQRFGQQWELVLQSYSIPLGDFVRDNPLLDLSTLREIRLVFDITEAGTVVVDDIGFSKLDPAFLRVSVAK